MTTKKETIKEKFDGKGWLIELEEKLNDIFGEKLPAMPESVKELIVKYGPYLAVVMLVFTIPTLLMITGFGMMVGFWRMWVFLVTLVTTVGIVALEVMAISGLFKRQKRAWKLLFYISLIQAVSSILRFDLAGLVIGTGLSWYILFQIRSYYKN